jgi:hypothetical protein
VAAGLAEAPGGAGVVLATFDDRDVARRREFAPPSARGSSSRKNPRSISASTIDGQFAALLDFFRRGLERGPGCLPI